MAAALMQHGTQQQQYNHTSVPMSAAEEVYIEELAVVASCCQAVAGVVSGHRLPALQQLPGEELVVSLLQSWESQGSVQVLHISPSGSCAETIVAVLIELGMLRPAFEAVCIVLNWLSPVRL